MPLKLRNQERRPQRQRRSPRLATSGEKETRSKRHKQSHPHSPPQQGRPVQKQLQLKKTAARHQLRPPCKTAAITRGRPRSRLQTASSLPRATKKRETVIVESSRQQLSVPGNNECSSRENSAADDASVRESSRARRIRRAPSARRSEVPVTESKTSKPATTGHRRSQRLKLRALSHMALRESSRRLPRGGACPCCEADSAGRGTEQRRSRKKTGSDRPALTKVKVALERLDIHLRSGIRTEKVNKQTHLSGKSRKKTQKPPVSGTRKKYRRRRESPSCTGRQGSTSKPLKRQGRRRGRPRGRVLKPWPARRAIIGADSLLRRRHRPVSPDTDPAEARRLASRRPRHDMCSICGAEEGHFPSLRRHVQQQHGLLTCGRCRLCFSSRARLLRHRRLAAEPLPDVAPERPRDVASSGRRRRARRPETLSVVARIDEDHPRIQEDPVDEVLVVFLVAAIVCCSAFVFLRSLHDVLEERCTVVSSMCTDASLNVIDATHKDLSSMLSEEILFSFPDNVNDANSKVPFSVIMRQSLDMLP